MRDDEEMEQGAAEHAGDSHEDGREGFDMDGQEDMCAPATPTSLPKPLSALPPRPRHSPSHCRDAR